MVQGLWSSHRIGGLWQPSVGSQLSTVLASWSSQLSGVCTQPVVALQLSVVQASWSSQSSGVPGTQVPARHVSSPLQVLLSPHAVPSATGAKLQRPAWQVSAVQTLASVQSPSVAQGMQPSSLA